MYGRYSNFRNFARKEAAKAKRNDDYDGGDAGGFSDRRRTDDAGQCTTTCRSGFRWWRHALLGRYAQDWIFLTLLGFMVAIFSFLIDVIVDRIQTAHRWVYREASPSVVGQYFIWIFFPIVLICFSTGFTHIVGPTAIGSGIPEVKTIMKGVILKEYLTLRTLVAKVVGLSSSLGSGLPLGKVGPFVHVANVSAAVLSQLFTSFRHELENESRKVDILTAASAVGVSCTFAAPIGGVLFSIEATATYFAVRNYWRGFYSAICGAIMFRLLALWFRSEETLTALFKTSLRQDTAYDVFEMTSFVAVGVICGIFGALFVYVHKNIVLFIRRRKELSSFLQKYRLVYPTIVTLVIMSVLFPGGFGKYMAGGLSLREAINHMFDNRTWSLHEPVDLEEARILELWKGPKQNVFLTLFLFFVMRFWMCCIATTLPVPCGIFIPAFGLGASVGRLIGELIAFWFPFGIRGKPVIPGAYAIVGAATFSAGVTHTVSPAVIVFELTGHMAHILPCVIAVMVAAAVANLLQPSAYDAMIEIKNLPFLPATIDPDICNAHQVDAEVFMIRDIHFLTLKSTYNDVLELLHLHSFRSYPLVDNAENMKLLGSIQRKELKRILNELFSYEKKNAFLSRRSTVPPLTVSETDLNNDSATKTTEVQSDVRPGVLLALPPYKRPSLDKQEIQVRRGSGSLHNYTISRVQDEGGLQSRKSSVGTEGIKKLEEDNTKQECRVKFLLSDTEMEADTSAQEMEDVEWKLYELNQPINFEECFVDPAPFQFSARTSLYKVHWLFSLLSLHHAYVTDSGHLVGIVSLSEVRNAIQGFLNVIPTIRKHQKRQHKEDPEVTKSLQESSPAKKT